MHNYPRITHQLATCVVALIVFAGGPAKTQARELTSEVSGCDPKPKPLHYELLSDDRESIYGHRGRVRVSFIVDRDGRVRDVRIEESTDDWFNERVIQSVLRWRYVPRSRECRTLSVFKFEPKD
jgi:TonB family protein